MKTSDVRVGYQYLYKGEIVTVLRKIKGRETVKRNMQSGEFCTGYHRMKKKFELSNDEIVYADKLEGLYCAECGKHLSYDKEMILCSSCLAGNDPSYK